MKVKLEEQELEQVSEFVYLGSLITEDGKCTADVKRRIGLASAVNGRFGKIWKSRNISNKTKVQLYESFVIPVGLLMYPIKTHDALFCYFNCVSTLKAMF